MTLSPGTNLGLYQIVAPLGAGGMGEVYLARDSKLDRQVAIKVLPEAMTRDKERVARFEREAKLLASLNHTNIAAIYGFDEADGTRFLVMEYVEGETLAHRLKSGAFAVEDALDVAKQMAEALEAAHDKGVIHRDLKPANVMIRPDGSVKVLDFGLAKAMAGESSAPTPADSPTITANHTRPGVVLGTAAYMSPEQARGKPLDKRTDIWSFGVVFLECLTGRTVFGGETISDSIGAILHKEPDWSLLPPSTPSPVRLLLRRCLNKDRRCRLQAIGDARVELEEVGSTDELLGLGATNGRRNVGIVPVLPWVLCGMLAIAMIIVLARSGDKPAAPIVSQIKKSTLTFPPNTSIKWRGTKDSWSKIGFSQLLAISRDGQRIIVTVQKDRSTSLYLKNVNDFAPRIVRGTDGARGAFFSPDGMWVGFVKENAMLKVRLPGGTPQRICEVSSTAFDATWLDDGTIIFSSNHGLRQVASDGGESQTLTSIDIDKGFSGHDFPHAIVGTRLVIFTATTNSGQHAALLSLDDLKWKILKKYATNARYVESGHLVFARKGELLASPYDPTDPMNVGTEAPIVQGVHTIPGQGGAIVHLFNTSQTGVLMYAPHTDPPEPDALVWVDHEGNEEGIVQGAGLWMHQRLSPDGKHILFNRLTSDGMFDLHIYDVQREQINPLTRRGYASDAEWSPDGRTVCFNAIDTAATSVYLIPADFSSQARKILGRVGSRPHLCQWSNDGATLVFFERSEQGGILTASPNGQDRLHELLNTSLGEAWAHISPDGRLIAYVGWEADQRNVYAQAYPDLGPRIRVSSNGGGEPRWTRDSRSLYYRAAGRIFRADIVIEPELSVTTVNTLPIDDVYDSAGSGHQHYDLSLDGTRFLMVKHGRRVYPTSVHIIENWASELGSNSTP